MTATTVVRYAALTRDMVAAVAAQLPRTLHGKLTVEVRTDAMQFRPVARFQDAKGREWLCPLEQVDVNGVPVSIKVPDTMLARLCVEVV